MTTDCKPLTFAIVSFGIATVRDANGVESQIVTQNQVCFAYPTWAIFDFSEDLGDGCELVERRIEDEPKPSVPFRGDIGVVTVTGGANGTNTLKASATSDCYESSLGDGVLPFADGDLLTIEATGGADFPAFTTTLEVPPVLVLAPVTIERGAPLSLSWNEMTHGKVRIEIRSTTETDFAMVTCEVPDKGNATIPARVTSRLLEGGTFSVTATRQRSDSIRTKDVEQFIQVAATTSDSRL